MMIKYILKKMKINVDSTWCSLTADDIRLRSLVTCHVQYEIPIGENFRSMFTCYV